MKKLKLKSLDLSNSEIFSREQLKMIVGGDGSGSGIPGCTTVGQGSVSRSCPIGLDKINNVDTCTFDCIS